MHSGNTEVVYHQSNSFELNTHAHVHSRKQARVKQLKAFEYVSKKYLLNASKNFDTTGYELKIMRVACS